MTAQDIDGLLTAFHNALRMEGPLDVNVAADRALYVAGLHGPRDAVGSLRRDILRTEGGGVFLFTGQAGSGKSTELQRLRRDLLAKNCKVYYCDLVEWLNFNEPVTLSSFLVALLSSWVDQIGTLVAQRTPAERLISFFTGTRLIPEQLKLDAGVALKAQIQFALQSDENFRRDLEANLRKQLSSIVQQAHTLVAQLKLDLCPHGEKCVLLADSMETLAGYGDDARKVYDSVQRLFVSEGSALKLPGLHVVYSVSPFLLEQNNQLPSALGMGAVVTMPSVHVFQRNSTLPDAQGVAAVTDLVARRFARWSEVFTAAQLETIILNTGGDLREMLRAIRVAINEDIEALPVTDAVVGFALNSVRPPKVIPAEHLAWMARLESSHETELGGGIDALVLQRYLATKHVLVYLNGEPWYAVHPLLRAWVTERAAKLAAEASAQAATAAVTAAAATALAPAPALAPAIAPANPAAGQAGG